MHWVSDCALYDGGSGWVVLQIRRRRRGQQLINNPGDSLMAAWRGRLRPRPVQMHRNVTEIGDVFGRSSSYPWRKLILLPSDRSWPPLLSTCWSEFALLKASVNSRDTLVNNYPLFISVFLGVVRILKTHSSKPWQKLNTTISVIPGKSYQLPFI